MKLDLSPNTLALAKHETLLHMLQVAPETKHFHERMAATCREAPSACMCPLFHTANCPFRKLKSCSDVQPEDWELYLAGVKDGRRL